MLSKEDVRFVKEILPKWNQFRHERNMPNYQGKITPSWMTMIEREHYLDKALNILERMIHV